MVREEEGGRGKGAGRRGEEGGAGFVHASGDGWGGRMGSRLFPDGTNLPVRRDSL